MSLDLYTKYIDDEYVRKNFERIEEAWTNLVFTRGDFEFFEFKIDGAQEAFKLYHNLGFSPNDIITTKAIGSSFEFNYEEFNDQYLTIKTTGDLYLRMIIGNLRGDEVAGVSAFAGITDDLGGSGGTGGGSVTFYKKDIIVGLAFLSNRTIPLQAAPATDSERVYVNGLLIDDSNYTFSGTDLIINPGLNIAVGDEIYTRFAN